MPITLPGPSGQDENKQGITANDMDIRVTSEGTIAPNRLGEIPAALSSGGDSQNPLDFAFSVPLRGIGIAGQAIGAALKGTADVVGMLPPVDFLSDIRVGSGTIGDAVGGLGTGALDLLGRPGKFVAENAPVIGAKARAQNPQNLPQDIRAMIASGASSDQIAEYMYKTGRAFSNDETINLGASILLDPLNLTPAIVGKMNLAKAGTRAASVGAGIAAGSVAGPVGAAAGGVAGFIAGGKISSRFTGILDQSIGMNLGPKIRAVQATQDAGKALEPWMQKYRVLSALERGTFGKIRGLSQNVKAGMAHTLGQSMAKGYGDDGLNLLGRAAERIGGQKGLDVAIARLGIANQNTVISSVRDAKFGSVRESAAVIVDLLDADIKVALQEFRELGIEGKSSDYVLKRLSEFSKNYGGSIEDRYALSLDEIKGYLQDTSNIFGSRKIDPKTGYEILGDDSNITIAQKRLRARLTERAAAVEFGPTYNAVDDAVRNYKLSQESVQASTRNSIEASVSREIGIIRLGNAAANELIRDYAIKMAQNMARANIDDSVRSSVPVRPSAEHINIVLEEIFGGAKLSANGMVVGGKYFDDTGKLKKSANIQRELGKRAAMARAYVYGNNVNRLGNIRRIFTVANQIVAKGLRGGAELADELNRLLGTPVSRAKKSEYAALTEDTRRLASRVTIVRNDSLLDFKVRDWVRLYDELDQLAAGNIQASDVASVPQDVLAEITQVIMNADSISQGLLEARKIWARGAAREFADVSDMLTGAQHNRGYVPPAEVYGMLNSSLKNGAYIVSASGQEIAAIKAAWKALGANSDEIDDVIRSLEADGYRIGLAPESGMMKTPVLLGRVRDGDQAIPQMATESRPFVDITSDFVDGLPEFGVKGSYQVGYARRALQAMMAPISQGTIGNAALARMHLLLGNNFSIDEIDEFYRRANQFAVERRIGVRGLDEQDYDMIMDGILRENGSSLQIRKTGLQSQGIKLVSLQNQVARALAGELKDVGYSQYITGKAKTVSFIGLGKGISKIAEAYYPALKYKYNPLFFVQELIESPFFAELRGIHKGAIELKLQESGVTAQELRASFGERASSLAQQVHDMAFYTSLVSQRAGLPSTIKDGIRLKDVFLSGDEAILDTNSSGMLSGVDKKLEPKWAKAAEFKESYRDIMAVSEMAEEFQGWVRQNRPAEFLALSRQYGDNALDQMLGWYTEYKRLQTFKFGGSALDSLKKPGFGFAVNPNGDILNMVVNDADLVAKVYSPEAFAALIEEGVRPEVVASVLRARIVNTAKDGGFDVTRLNDALNRIEFDSASYARELQRPSTYINDARDAYVSSINYFVETAQNLRIQFTNSEINKVIVSELMENFNPGLGSGQQGAALIEALANAKKYGAELNILADLIEEIRTRASAVDTTPATRAQIRSIVNSLVGGESPLAARARSTQKILSDSASLMFEKHAGEEAMFQAARWSYQTAAKAMDRVNYFNRDRGWLERSINHQFLGLYPFSYMMGKVLPELARFMFYKPFGAIAPGAGYVAYNKIKDYLERNPMGQEYEDMMEQPEYLFLLAQLIPGHPDDLTVVLPAWFRSSVSTVSRQGYDQLNATDAIDMAFKPFTTGGLLGTADKVLKSITELTTPQRLPSPQGEEFSPSPAEFRR